MELLECPHGLLLAANRATPIAQVGVLSYEAVRLLETLLGTVPIEGQGAFGLFNWRSHDRAKSASTLPLAWH